MTSAAERGERTKGTLAVLALGLVVLSGCEWTRSILGQKKPAPAASTGTDAGGPTAGATPAAGGPRLHVFAAAEQGFTEAVWTHRGDVLALGAHRLWRLAPEGERLARTTPIPGARPRLAAARAADVAVVTSDLTAHVFRAGVLASSFPIEADANAEALSDDGALLVTSSRGEAGIYDVGSGVRLATLAGLGPLSSGDGRWMITTTGIRSTRTGEVVVSVASEVFARRVNGAAWVGPRAIMWSTDGLLIVDPETKETKRVVASCAEDSTDVVDVARGRAIRVCRARLFVVPFDGRGGTPIEVPFRPRKPFGQPAVAFAEDTADVFLEWYRDRDPALGHESSGPALERIDLARRSVQSATPAAPLRQADGTVVMTDEAFARPSPNGQLLLWVSEGALVVSDRASGDERVRWGLPRATPPRDARSVAPPSADLAAFLHEDGLEVAAEVDAPSVPHGILTTRLGPPASHPFASPFLSAQPPCSRSPLGASYVGEREVLFVLPWDTCICDAAGCKSTEFSPWLRVRSREGGIFYRPNANTFGVLEGGVEKPVGMNGSVLGATFLDGASFAAVVRDLTAPEQLEIVEVALPSLAIRRRLKLAAHPLESPLHPAQLLATREHFVVVKTSRARLHADLFPRRTADGGAPPIAIDAWLGGARIQLPDGRVELLGPAAEDSVACLDADGTARGFATCRERYEAKGVFRLD
jgi:hypothetical protein